MKSDLPAKFTGGSFIAAAAMLWLGWMLMPTHLGTFFEPDDFGEVHSSWTWWIWCYRFHLFGHVISVIALVALATQVSGSAARVMIWPGVAVAAAGIFVTALAHAFYYHHGAWGALEMQGKSAAEVQAFTDSLRIDTEYVTCLVRFGRVFTGLGVLLLAAGLFVGKLQPTILAGLAALIGLAAMSLTMGLPDDLHLYRPVFHAWTAWLLGTGGVVVRSGIPKAEGA